MNGLLAIFAASVVALPWPLNVLTGTGGPIRETAARMQKPTKPQPDDPKGRDAKEVPDNEPGGKNKPIVLEFIPGNHRSK